MALKYDGNDKVYYINYNGNKVKTVRYNGKVVWPTRFKVTYNLKSLRYKARPYADGAGPISATYMSVQDKPEDFQYLSNEDYYGQKWPTRKDQLLTDSGEVWYDSFDSEGNFKTNYLRAFADTILDVDNHYFEGGAVADIYENGTLVDHLIRFPGAVNRVSTLYYDYALDREVDINSDVYEKTNSEGDKYYYSVLKITK